MEKCPKEHSLLYIENCEKIGTNDFFKCNYCKKPCHISLGKYYCNICNLNICCLCKKSLYRSSFCCNIHPLMWTPTNIMPEVISSEESGKCFQCGTAISATAGRWSCSSCPFYVCSSCKKPPYDTSICPKGHQLSFFEDDLDKDLFFCAYCYSEKYKFIGHWSCLSCNIAICSECKANPKSVAPMKRKPSELVILKHYSVAPKTAFITISSISKSLARLLPFLK